MSEGALEVRTFVSTAFGQNAYVVRRNGAGEGVAIDPGAEAAAMADWADAAGCRIVAIVLTHAHLDHVEGVGTLVERTGAPVWLHPADRQLYDNVAQQGAMFGLRVDTPPPPDHDIVAGAPLELAGITFEVRHAPGHAPGHVVLHVADAGLAFVGDVVFQGSIGRTDLPGGSYADLMAAIRTQVLSLPDETRLYTGHGPPTSVAHERATNPFLIPQFGGGLA